MCNKAYCPGMESLLRIDQWPVPHAAAGVVRADGQVAGVHGDASRAFPLASVTKPLTAYAALIAIQEGVVELDSPAGPEGSTIRHLLAHTAGLAFDEHSALVPPGKRRMYSSAGFEQLAEAISKHAGIAFPDYVRDGLLAPLGMSSTRFDGSPASGASSTVDDLLKFAAELQSPVLLDPSTLSAATTVAFPDLNGVLPGYGQQKPNDWGLGFEIRDGKSPHWTGILNSARTFGHFGQTGTFLWVDPDLGAACVALTDRNFGPWAVETWPPFSDAVVTELRG